MVGNFCAQQRLSGALWAPASALDALCGLWGSCLAAWSGPPPSLRLAALLQLERQVFLQKYRPSGLRCTHWESLPLWHTRPRCTLQPLPAPNQDRTDMVKSKSCEAGCWTNGGVHLHMRPPFQMPCLSALQSCRRHGPSHRTAAAVPT